MPELPKLPPVYEVDPACVALTFPDYQDVIFKDKPLKRTIQLRPIAMELYLREATPRRLDSMQDPDWSYAMAAALTGKTILEHFQANPGWCFVPDRFLWAHLNPRLRGLSERARPTVFQWFYAVNAARFVVGWPTGPNLAIRNFDGEPGMVICDREDWPY